MAAKYPGAHLHAELRVEQDRARERIPHARRAHAGERPQVRRPAVDQSLLRGAVPSDGERFRTRHREHQSTPETTRAADGHARGIEDHVGELEAVAHVGQCDGVAARHHPVADVALREARAQVHFP
jgi:hypothetical protein